jgi:hypothetical protein
MSREHEELCETCGEYEDVRNMHRVEIERVVGRETGRSTSSRHGNRHSTSTGGASPMRIGNGYSRSQTSRSVNRTIRRRERVWVCNDCPDPPTPGRGMRRVLLFAVIVIAVIWGVTEAGINVGALFDAVSRPAARPSGGISDTMPATRPDAKASTDARRAEPPAPMQTIQSLPAPKSTSYPPCSATVTDHCTSS